MTRYTDCDFNEKTVLVTGGAGFIGSNLVFHLQNHYPQCKIVVFDAFALGHFKNLRGFRGQCVAGDIACREDLQKLERYRFDHVFHQAAISDTTVSDQQRMIRVNTDSFRDLLRLESVRQASVVYASSAGVYGNSAPPHRVGQGETPENIYGFSKLMLDQAAAEIALWHPAPIIGLRYFNVYGPRESYKGSTASMALQLGRKLLREETPKLFKYGEQKRDFVFIEDVIQANMKAAAASQSGVYNVGGGKARSYNDLLKALCVCLHCSVEPEYIDNPWGFFQNHTQADIAETRRKLDYEPQYSLEEGLRAYAPEIRRLAERAEKLRAA